MDGRRYLLTDVEFDVLWEDLTRADPDHRPPPALRLDSPGRSHAERGRVRAAAWQALRDRGLVGASDADPGLLRALRPLLRPARQLELRARWGGRLRAVAAGRDGVGALAVRAGNTVLVAGCDSLPVALLGVLAPGPPGPGPAGTVPSSALAPTDPPAAPPVAAEARRLRRVLAAVERRAQVVALVESPPGDGLARRGGVIGVLDGPRGSYLVTRAVGSDGTEWITVAPCHPRRLRHLVAGLLPPWPPATSGRPAPGRPPPRPPRPPR